MTEYSLSSLNIDLFYTILPYWKKHSIACTKDVLACLSLNFAFLLNFDRSRITIFHKDFSASLRVLCNTRPGTKSLVKNSAQLFPLEAELTFPESYLNLSLI